MHQKSNTMIKVLLNRYHEGEVEKLLEYLPDDVKKSVTEEETNAKDSESALIDPIRDIESIHYSWLLDVFDQFPKPLANSILAALPSAHRKGISTMLDIKYTPLNLGDRIKKYLLYLMTKEIYQSDILPIPFLPKTALSPILKMEKHKLVLLVDLLGIHDLAEKIRHIVDKSKLKMIYQCLNPTSLKYLSHCLHQIEKIAISDLNISRWDGDCVKLNKMIHKKGLNRLSKALSGQHPHFIWHLCHRFDKGRGEFLQKNIKAKPIQNITLILAEQVLNVVNMLNSKERA